MKCIFCKIIKNEIPSSKVYEDDDFIAILDIAPANTGHTLIIPKKHVEVVDEFDLDYMVIVKKVAKAIITSTKCHGYNVLINNHRAAGQEVEHLHIHIIPRFSQDNFSFKWSPKEYIHGEMKTVAEDIKKYL